MYGTIARLKVKPGMMSEFLEWANTVEAVDGSIPGEIAVYVYQADSVRDEFWMVVMFEDKASYVANAQNPEQHQRFLSMMKYLAAEPEWHDGEIVWSSTR